MNNIYIYIYIVLVQDSRPIKHDKKEVESRRVGLRYMMLDSFPNTQSISGQRFLFIPTENARTPKMLSGTIKWKQRTELR